LNVWKKIENNQQTTNTNVKNLEKQMDGKFATMESNLLKAIQASKEATPAPAGNPGPSSGAALPSFFVADATARYLELLWLQPLHGLMMSPLHISIGPLMLLSSFVIFMIVFKWQNPNSAKKMLVLVAESGLKEQDFLLWGCFGFRFEMQFTGDVRVASVKAKQFHMSLQLGRGKWKPQEVECSLGATHKFHINPDKNPAQTRKEVLAAR